MNALRRHQFAHPKPAETFLGDTATTCGCDAQLVRPVLVEALSPRSLRACMKCGSVTCSEARGDDGRYTGRSCVVHVLIEHSSHVMRWIAQWPRVKVIAHEALWFMHPSLVRTERVYAPAQLRCGTPSRLDEQEARLMIEQTGLTMRDRLVRCGFPTEAPPANLPNDFSIFAKVWNDLQLTPESDPEHLLDRAYASSAIAADLLVQRTDALNLLDRALRTGRQDSALAMLRAGSPAPPDLATTLIDALGAIPMTPSPNVPDRISQRHRMEVLLLMIAERKLSSPAMSAALRALMRKVARHDATLVSCIRIVLRQLEAPAP